MAPTDARNAIRSKLVQLGIRLFETGETGAMSQADVSGPTTSGSAQLREGTQRLDIAANLGAEMDEVLASNMYQRRPTVQIHLDGASSDKELIQCSNRRTLLAQKLTILALQRLVRQIAATSVDDETDSAATLPIWVKAEQQVQLERNGLRPILKSPPSAVTPVVEYLERSRDWIWENELSIAHMFRGCLDAQVGDGMIGTANVDKQYRVAKVTYRDKRTPTGEPTQQLQRELTLSDVLVLPRATHDSILQRYMPSDVSQLLQQAPELLCLREVIVGTVVQEQIVDGEEASTTRIHRPQGMITLFRHYVLATWYMTDLEQQVQS